MEALGLDIKLLVAQIVNFGILFFVLKKILYKPIIKLLDDRKQKIEESLQNSKKIQDELSKLDSEKVEIVKKIQNEAKKDKDEIISQAQEEKRKIIDEARKTAEAALAKSTQRINALEESVYENIKKRFMNEAVGELVKKLETSKIKDKFTNKVLN